MLFFESKSAARLIARKTTSNNFAHALSIAICFAVVFLVDRQLAHKTFETVDKRRKSADFI